MPRAVYEVSTEILPGVGAEFPTESTGAFVSCFVAAEDLIDAIEAAVAFLEDDHYRVIDVDRADRIEFEEYVPEDEDYPNVEELRRALLDDEILTGPFLCYEESDLPEEPDEPEA